MTIDYMQIGICGLSCRLCPMYHTDAKSRCEGCKSEYRMSAGCPFITCAVKNKGIEFCWECKESTLCDKWRAHREKAQNSDSFKCYQTLEDDIAFILANGVDTFEKQQIIREQLLLDMLEKYNDGRSKSHYCIAATVMQTDELHAILKKAKHASQGLDMKQKAKLLRRLIADMAAEKGYRIHLRK